MDQSVLDLDLGGDSNFEPQQRQRSNTWPLPRPDNYVDTDEKDPVNGVGGGATPGLGHAGSGLAGSGLAVSGLGGGGGGGGGVESTVMMGLVNNTMLTINGDGGKTTLGGTGVPTAPKKNSSRRNAWGNMSYADLITQAIQSCADKRLTLSQIYDWMVQNVPYFKDKGDSNSSAGWKVRHFISFWLHYYDHRNPQPMNWKKNKQTKKNGSWVGLRERTSPPPVLLSPVMDSASTGRPMAISPLSPWVAISPSPSPRGLGPIAGAPSIHRP